MRGWEPLGNICKATTAKDLAEPWKAVEPATGGTGHFHGSWGFHFFTLANLLNRAYAYWCTFSDDWSSFDYIRFLGMKVRILGTPGQAWMINFDNYLMTKNVLIGTQNNEDQWIHPGVLLNDPKTHIILGPDSISQRKMYTIKIYPPPGWKGYERLPAAMDYVLCHWAWSWCDLRHCFWDYCPCGQPSGDTQCMADPWWGIISRGKEWVNRQKYKACSSGNQENKTWGPFLPSLNCKGPEFSTWFRYTIYFKFAGDSLWRPLPTSFNRNGMVPDAPGPSQAETDSGANHQKRPRAVYDIWPGDLDSDGILKSPALKRITGHSPESKRRKMGKRARYFLRQLKSVGDRIRRRLGDDPPHTPPGGGEPGRGPLHPRPTHEKIYALGP